MRKPILCGALCCALAAMPAFAGEPAGSDTTLEAVAVDLQAEIDAGRLTGVAVALVHDGRIVWEAGFGQADREAGRAVTPRTPFSIASTTKPITTTALMTLVQAGKLDLDQPANAWLGDDRIVDADGPARAVTLRRLATHSSGLPTFFEMYAEGSAVQPPTVSELIRDYGHIVAPAGERYEYSNLGMAVVADIVARRSGRSFGQYLHEAVFAPLGMDDAFLGSEYAAHPGRATRYGDDGTPLPFYLTATPGSGEVYASARDLARFAMLHLGDDVGGAGKILDAAHLSALHRPATPIAPGFSYGMGWQVLERAGQPAVLYHGGGQSGVSTEFGLVPSADAACIVLSNRRGSRAFLESVRDRMLRTVVPGWTGIPPTPAGSLVPLAPLPDYAGTWRGMLHAPGRDVPVVLAIRGADDATLSVDGHPPQPVTDLGLIDGLLNGDSLGDIGSADTRREGVRKLSLNLKYRGDRIDGEIIAWRKESWNMTILPHWTELHRDTR
jgi:CubicO group peptidase (beta-lactamase class C family)